MVAGNGHAGFDGDGGPAVRAKLDGPLGMARDRAGVLYLADNGNNRIRRISTDGTIETIAGTGEPGFSGDGGPAVKAQLAGPNGIVLDSEGSLYFADSDNNRVRKVDADGVITTIAGTGSTNSSGDGGPATKAGLSAPSHLVFDRRGNLFVSESGAGKVRRISAEGTISTYAGGRGAAENQLHGANGLAFDSDGNLLVADFDDCLLRLVEATGRVRTLSGTGAPSTGMGCASAGDGGQAIDASLDRPPDVAIGPDGSIYVLEHFTGNVRRIDPGGRIDTLAIAHRFGEPLYMLLVGRDLYVADRDHAVIVRVLLDH